MICVYTLSIQLVDYQIQTPKGQGVNGGVAPFPLAIIEQIILCADAHRAKARNLPSGIAYTTDAFLFVC